MEVQRCSNTHHKYYHLKQLVESYLSEVRSLFKKKADKITFEVQGSLLWLFFLLSSEKIWHWKKPPALMQKLSLHLVTFFHNIYTFNLINNCGFLHEASGLKRKMWWRCYERWDDVCWSSLNISMLRQAEQYPLSKIVSSSCLFWMKPLLVLHKEKNDICRYHLQNIILCSNTNKTWIHFKSNLNMNTNRKSGTTVLIMISFT